MGFSPGPAGGLCTKAATHALILPAATRLSRAKCSLATFGQVSPSSRTTRGYRTGAFGVARRGIDGYGALVPQGAGGKPVLRHGARRGAGIIEEGSGFGLGQLQDGLPPLLGRVEVAGDQGGAAGRSAPG